MKNGLISVIMGVHNEKDEYLKLAIKSICEQEYSNFEFIIVDDCSDEHCKSLLEELASKDSRIRLFRNKENQGLTKSLNIGLTLAEGEFIARMDADDYSTIDRFAKQVNYLKCNADIDILGGGVVSFGDSTIFMSPAFGYTNEEAQCELFFQSTLCHPSVMIRRSFLDKHSLTYDENVKKGQDYDMWERCSVYGKLAVMQDVVLYYRVHAAQITSTNRKDQDGTAKNVRLRRISRLGITPTDAEYNCHLMLLGQIDNSISISDVDAWRKKLLDVNGQVGLVDKNYLEKSLNNRYVLYKARHGKHSISDIPVLAKTVLQRIKMKNKLNVISKMISNTLK